MRAFTRKLRPIGVGVIVSLAAALAGPAQAALEARDLSASGDGKMTLDTATNLLWLDLNLSQPWAINSSNIYTAAGWQVASLAQVKTLIGNHFGLTPAADGNRHTVDSSKAQSFINLLGVTYTESNLGMSWGRFQSDTEGRAGHAIVRQDSFVSYLIDADGHSAGSQHSFSGVFYVKAVPEPAALTMLLAGLGVVGFAVRRRAAGDAAGSVARAH
jgi:hypothetical protein